MPKGKSEFAVSELFTFSRLTPVRIVDVEYRLARQGVPEDPEARQAWVSDVRGGAKEPRNLGDLSYGYTQHLKEGFDLTVGLPGRDDLQRPGKFDGAKVAQSPEYRADLARVEQLFLAVTLDRTSDDEARRSAARLLQFVERFPRLADAPHQPFFAPVLRRREAPPAPKPAGEKRKAAAAPEAAIVSELTDAIEALQKVWRARDAKISKLDTEYRALRSNRTGLLRAAVAKAMSVIEDAVPAPKGGKAMQKLAARRERDLRAAAMSTARQEVRETIDAARRAYADAKAKGSLSEVIVDPKNAPDDVAAEIQKVKDLMAKLKLPPDGFCQLYAAVLERLDQIDHPAAREPDREDQVREVWDAPEVRFADTVRMLGKAELVKVEEEFVGYSPAEISYIQTVMPGEQRVRKTRSANVQETLLEKLDDETTERTDESSASTKSELKSEIETELRSRFESNVSASGSGQGGGSIGVVDFSGSGSVSAGLGIGLDTGLRTSNESQFSQEILRKAVERTNHRTLERRLTTSRQSYSASDMHQLSNTTDKPINGTYVFLNKQVAVTETVYGVRAFLEAKLIAPGRSLVAARQSQQRALTDELGERPRFDLTPADITPANYMKLAGRYRASNIEPPPGPVTRLTRVYKTDSASSTSASEGGSGEGNKLADVLVPFYGKYKRFAITDNVDLPEGYAVLDVDVAVSHGANGVSLPAHLPLTLPGAAFYAGTSFTPFVTGLLGIAFLPAWVWSVAYMASPVLHYNTDSSNVTVTIGTEGKDSAYYFFEPDDLFEIIMELMNAISAASPQFLQNLQSLALQRIGEAQTAAAKVPAEIAKEVAEAIDSAVNKIRAVLDALIQADLNAALTAMTSVTPADLALTDMDEIKDVFKPLTNLIADLVELLKNEVGEAIQFTLGQLMSRLENNQKLEYTASRGMEGKLPIAINALALHPGVTVTVAACLRRTSEGLARWQLRTFEQLYQAYLQQVAAYESQYYGSAPTGLARAPGLMRRDERIALKERIINALHALHPVSGGAIPIERLELFEHAIEWDNMSYRMFNYGPSAEGMALENAAVLAGGDDDRRRFLLATWSQVMIPLQAHDGLVAQFLDYLAGGTGSVADAVSDSPSDVPETDELTALYRDLVLSRSLIAENPPSGEPRFVTLPTDLVALFEPNLAANLPRNPASP